MAARQESSQTAVGRRQQGRTLEELCCRRETEAGKGWDAPTGASEGTQSQLFLLPLPTHPSASAHGGGQGAKREQEQQPLQHRQPPASQYGVRGRSTSSVGWPPQRSQEGSNPAGCETPERVVAGPAHITPAVGSAYPAAGPVLSPSSWGLIPELVFSPPNRCSTPKPVLSPLKWCSAPQTGARCPNCCSASQNGAQPPRRCSAPSSQR